MVTPSPFIPGEILAIDVERQEKTLSQGSGQGQGQESGQQQEQMPSQEHTDQAITLILSAYLKSFHGVPIRFNAAARKAHLFAFTFRPIFSFSAFILVLLTFFEPPSWCVLKFGAYQCIPPPTQMNPYLPILQPIIIIFSIEFLCIILLCVESALYMFAQGFTAYFERPLHKIIIFLLSLYVAEFLCSIIVTFYGLPWLRIAPYSRIIFLGIRNRQIRRQISLIVRILPSFCLVLVLIAFTIISFALIGMALFPSVLDEKILNLSLIERFGVYLELMWRVFVGNSAPKIIDEKRNENFSYFSFFLLFTIITVIFMQNLLTAVVYNGYQEEAENEAKEENKLISNIMDRAWSRIDSQAKDYITLNEFEYLLQRMRTYVQFWWILNPETFDLFFWILDSDSSGQVTKDEFIHLLTILHLKFDLYYKNNFVYIWFPKFAQTKFYKSLSDFVKPEEQKDIHKITKFDVCVMTILSFMVAFSVVNIVLSLVQGKVSQISLIFEVVVFFLFFLEALIRASVFGWQHYWSESKFEFFLMMLQFFLCVIFFSSVDKEYEINISNRQGKFDIDFSLIYFYAFQIPGILRFFRVIILFLPLVKLVLVTFVRMILASYKLVYVLFSFIYLLSVLGVQILGSFHLTKSSSNNAKQMNDVTNAFLSFIEVLYSISISQTSLQYKELTGSGWVWVFFVIAYLILVFVCLNLVVSYTIQIFISELQRHDDSSFGRLQSIIFEGSYVYFSKDLVPYDIDNNVGMVRARVQGYTSHQFDRVKVVHDVFEKKIMRSIQDLQI